MLLKFIRVRSIGLCLALAFALYAALFRPAAAVVGAECGGFVGMSLCGRGEWCEHPPGICALQAPGRCAKAPVICALSKKSSNLFLPVCGCDGKTYANDCLRMRAMVSKAHDGRCYF